MILGKQLIYKLQIGLHTEGAKQEIDTSTQNKFNCKFPSLYTRLLNVIDTFMIIFFK
jgi:hypothetical protein